MIFKNDFATALFVLKSIYVCFVKNNDGFVYCVSFVMML